MKKTTFGFLITGLFMISCADDNQKMNGHWHEFIEDNQTSKMCIILNDSTMAINKYSDGGIFKRREFDFSDIWYLKSSIPNIQISENEIIFNEKLKWIRQKDNLETLITDFSIGLYVNIKPPVKKHLEFNFNDLEETVFQVFIGKRKNNKENYSIQTKDIIISIQDIPNELYRFILGINTDLDSLSIVISADSNTPQDLLSEIENEITKMKIKKNKIYYLNIDLENNVGYNH